jgi:hypothetical protein
LTATDSEVTVKLPQPCVIFLKNKATTPQKLTWKIEFFGGQMVTLDIPTLRLAELSLKEIGERDLQFTIQYNLRTVYNSLQQFTTFPSRLTFTMKFYA